MKIFFYVWILMASYVTIHAQTLNLRDRQTNEPIRMAAIVSDALRLNTTTNANGLADISGFAGASRIEIRMLGYSTFVTSFLELASQNFIVFLTPSTTNMDEVVISATRWSQRSGDVPARISQISAKEVALYNPQTAADVLGATGEVFVQKSQQGGGSPMIRGFAANRLLYSIDGIRMNTAIFRAGNLQNVISLDPLAIENTEVLFGPSSIIYGSDAIGGVMSFQTLTPQFSVPKNVHTSGKSVSRFSSANEEITQHFDVNVGGKKWASISSFTYSKYGDLKMGKNGPDSYLKKFYVVRIDNVDRVVENSNPLIQNPSGYSQINLMQKLRYSLNEKWDIQFGLHYSETSAYSRYDRLIETTNGLPTSAVWQYGPQIWRMNNLILTHKKGNFAYDQMTARLAEQYFEESRIDRRFTHHRLRTNLEQVRAYSGNLDFEKGFGSYRLFYGTEYVLNLVTSIGTAVDLRSGTPIAVPDRYPKSNWKSYGVYANMQYVASERFLAQAGVRVNAFNLKSDFTRHLSFFPFDFTTSSLKNAATTGSIGVIFRPDETTKIRVNASTGFRAPNVDDLGKLFDFGTGEVVVPNTRLNAEYAYNAELGMWKSFYDVVQLDITGFYTYLDQAMVRRPFTVNGQESIIFNGQPSKVYAIQNAAYGTVYGFNAALDIQLPADFRLTSLYNYQFGEEEMDNGTLNRSRHAAPAFGITRLSFRHENLTMELNTAYSAEVSYPNLNEEERLKPAIYATDKNGKPYAPAWQTFNLKAMYQFHPNLAISAGVENITDQRYRPYSSGLVAPGRNVILSLRTLF